MEQRQSSRGVPSNEFGRQLGHRVFYLVVIAFKSDVMRCFNAGVNETRGWNKACGEGSHHVYMWK